MANIVESISGDRRIQLGAEEFIRPFSFGASWTKIRIGLRLSILGRTQINNALFAVGVCQGYSGWNSPTPTDYFGFFYGGTGGPNAMSVTVGTVTYYTTSSGQATAIHRTGGVQTQVSSGVSGGSIGAWPTRTAWFVTITKSATMTIQLNWLLNPAADQSLLNFMLMEEDEAANAGLFSGWSSAAPTVSSGTSSGMMDSVSVSWNHSVPVMEISDLMVVKYT